MSSVIFFDKTEWRGYSVSMVCIWDQNKVEIVVLCLNGEDIPQVVRASQVFASQSL